MTEDGRIRLAIVGLGKMGLSHLALARAHPAADVVGICDSSSHILQMLGRYSGMATWSDYSRMLREANPDAVIIATPTRLHAPMVDAALERDIDVFCEKPFTLALGDGERLTERARSRGLVSQVGYHNRFLGTFQEVKRVIDSGALGSVTHVRAESYGPVVLRARGSTWRSRVAEGGGCLYDYAAHPVDLLGWLLGPPSRVSGSALTPIFSHEIDDEVVSTLWWEDGASAHLSVNWSDESTRKMTTSVSVWGARGRLVADRQECRTYLREDPPSLPGYARGWNRRFITDLGPDVWFYLRGEEYSAQIDYFLQSVRTRRTDGINSFAQAAATDRALAMIGDDARARRLLDAGGHQPLVAPAPHRDPVAARWHWRRRRAATRGAA